MNLKNFLNYKNVAGFHDICQVLSTFKIQMHIKVIVTKNVRYLFKQFYTDKKKM